MWRKLLDEIIWEFQLLYGIFWDFQLMDGTIWRLQLLDGIIWSSHFPIYIYKFKLDDKIKEPLQKMVCITYAI